MPTIGVQHCLRDFENSVQNATHFLQEAHNFRVPLPTGKYRHIGIRRIELLIGLTLLRIFIAWEDFLESVFVRYMCGASSASGFAPIILNVPEPTISAAMTRLLGRNHFLNWSAWNTLTRAGHYFDHGEPFATAIGAIRQTLDDISVVRNRFAHRSDFSARAFRDIVLGEFGYVPRGMTPGRFLLAPSPSLTSGGLSFLDIYVGSLIGASYIIVP